MNPKSTRLNARQTEILDIVRHQGYATIEALAGRFETSQQTIRRDIIRMDGHGLLQRFHGGAGSIHGHGRPLYADKQNLAVQAKRKIADKAAALIKADMTVFIDVGTTAEALARSLLRSKRSLRVVTSSLGVALILAQRQGLETIVAGGALASPDGALTGSLAVSIVNMFSYDYAFIGFSGFDLDGALMDFDLRKVAVKQEAMRRAKAVVGIVDSTKYHRQATIRMAESHALDYVVSDAQPPEELKNKLAAAGVRILAA